MESMGNYVIGSKSGSDLMGTFPGATPEEAIDAMARDAGYASHAEACKVTGEDPATTIATEVTLDLIVRLARKAKAGDTYLTDVPPTASDDTSGARYETRLRREGLTVTWGFSQEEVDAIADGDEGCLPWDEDHIVKVFDDATGKRVEV